MDPQEKRTLETVERVASALRARGVEPALIGATAAAVHNYPRATADIDLATFVNPYPALTDLRKELEADGYDVRFDDPDDVDPLGGVLTIFGDVTRDDALFTEIQIVNFLNPFGGGTTLGREAIEHASAPGLGSVPVVDLAHLIALKLYAGGFKSKNDVAELLQRNPSADLRYIADVCEKHALGEGLREVLLALGRTAP